MWYPFVQKEPYKLASGRHPSPWGAGRGFQTGRLSLLCGIHFNQSR
ncbi:hypothetical protein HMPREF0973_02357 [Prevotella veroralis F0319]|uniref:Uncharacterized protein n=1 Tax=Prevotella veroralis F0319 TaxID=649761 RepID=C9MRU4_9BACT|nr:hypothetical protein HMPREF0973_02357 [Prevotella veroralis F0319]